MNFPMDHRIKRPFHYTPATSTDVRKTFERVRLEQAKRAQVVPIKKESA